MTTDDTFGRSLTGWLHDEAEHRVPDHLADVLVHTVATRQRPWWSSPERWLPMDTATGIRGRLDIPRPLIWVALLALVIMAVVGTAILTGALRSPVPVFGTTTNGRIVIADGTSLKSYAADGTDPKDIATLAATGQDLTVSHDGTRVGLQVMGGAGGEHDAIVRLADGSSITLPHPTTTIAMGSGPSWSPDDQRVAYLSYDGSREHLLVGPADGSTFTELAVDAIDPAFGLWPPAWSPDGQWIAFMAGDRTTEAGNIYLIRPDGKELHAVVSSEDVVGWGVAWSPDPAVQRIVYTKTGNTVIIFDVASDRETVVAGGFWPTWSPDGEQLSYWTDGTVITTMAKLEAADPSTVRPYPSFSDSCQAHPDLAAKVFCGPAGWAPDGTRLIAPDILGTSVLSVPIESGGSSIVIALGSNVKDLGNTVIWQPIWP